MTGRRAAGSGTWAPSEHGRESGSMEKRVARGLLWTLIDTWGSQLLGLVIFAVLAHLLDPTDFGLVALAAVFVALGQLFADQGLGDAVIQRPSLTRLQLDTAFWAAVATGAILSLVGVALSGPVATLLGDQRLAPILAILSLIFLFVALSSIQIGLLRREMDFRSLALRKLSAVAIGGVVGVGMALGGYGAWALVGQQLASAIVSVVMLWAVSPWRPSFAFSAADFRSLFGYGLNVVGSDLLSFFSRNTDNLLVGVFLGPVALGFYAVAYRILDTSQQLLIAAARRLVFPSFARLQHDRDRSRRAYLRLARLTGAVILPGYVGLALVAPEAIVTLFGARWEPAGLTASILFLIGPALTVQAFSGALWNAVGHPGVTFRFRLVTTIVTVVGFIAAVLSFRDIVAVALAFTLPGYALLPLNLYWMSRYAGIPAGAQLWQLRGVAVSSSVMAVAVVVAKVVLAGQVHHAILLAAEVVIGAVAYSATLVVVERALLVDVLTIGARILPGGEAIARRFGFRVEPRRRPEQIEVDVATAAPPVADERSDAWREA